MSLEDEVLLTLARLREMTDSGMRHDLASVLLMTGLTEDEINEVGGMP